MRALTLASLLMLAACAKDAPLDPLGDEDGDGFTNGDEEAMGADPLDAEDVPYAGGWVKSPCPDDFGAIQVHAEQGCDFLQRHGLMSGQATGGKQQGQTYDNLFHDGGTHS